VKLNVGCGLQVMDGYFNVDIDPRDDRVVRWDMLHEPPILLKVGWDEIYCAHVLHMLTFDEVVEVLDKFYGMLGPEGVLHVVDMDLLLAQRAYLNKDTTFFPTWDPAESFDTRYCRFLSWHGTRRSLWTDVAMRRMMERVGFRTSGRRYGEHQLDQRQRESFFLVGRKQ
jgi:predicted SAM-dependent methyltransferase